MWKVKFKKKLYDELVKYLFELKPKENGCFVLAKTENNIMFITDILYPKNDDWLRCEEDLCSPNAEYISNSCLIANNQNKALAFIHSHPCEEHPSIFSEIDLISNKRMFENLKNIINGCLASFVFSKDGINGVVYSNNVEENVEIYSIHGDKVEYFRDTLINDVSYNSDIYDRQLRFLKNKGQSVLSTIKVGIVGLGGIGSPLALMLFKMGIRNFNFYDFDKVEIHNLPRIYGATLDKIGQYKVDVVRDFISLDNDEIKVNVFKDKITKVSNLSDNDVIFGCVDNHTTRDALNYISLSEAIPYIDSGCAIPLDEDGEVVQSAITVNTVLDGKPCLWCSNTLDGMRIMEESLSEEEIMKRKDEGYTSSIEKAPSVISLTSAVASFAINRFLNISGLLKGSHPVKSMFDFNNNMYFEPTVTLNSSCICKNIRPFE